jgi:hypothetical protein
LDAAAKPCLRLLQAAQLSEQSGAIKAARGTNLPELQKALGGLKHPFVIAAVIEIHETLELYRIGQVVMSDFSERETKVLPLLSLLNQNLNSISISLRAGRVPGRSVHNCDRRSDRSWIDPGASAIRTLACSVST